MHLTNSLKNRFLAPAGWLSWSGVIPGIKKIVGSIPGPGTSLVAGVHSCRGDPPMFSSLSLSLFKINKHILRQGFKKKVHILCAHSITGVCTQSSHAPQGGCLWNPRSQRKPHLPLPIVLQGGTLVALEAGQGHQNPSRPSHRTATQRKPIYTPASSQCKPSTPVTPWGQQCAFEPISPN